MNTTRFDGYMPEVLGEALNAERKHGPLTGDVVRASAILTEEVGEVASAALEATRAYATAPERLRCKWQAQGREHLRAELLQVAATALLFLEAMDKPEPPVNKE